MSRSAYYRSASGYYMPGSSAVAPEYWQQEEVQQEQQRRTSVKQNRKPEVVQWLATLSIVFIMGLALAGQNAYIGNLGYDVTQTKNELRAVQAQNEKIKNQISAAGGLQHVETVAVNFMGMHKPSEQEIIYLSATK